jgi:hypothetical protein
MTRDLKKEMSKVSLNQKKWEEARKKAEELKILELESWKKYEPKYRKIYDELPDNLKGPWGDSFPEGLRCAEIQLVDGSGTKLDFRVGPVFSKDGVWETPGLWIGVQRRYMSSDRDIELLISPETWIRLNKELMRRFKKYDPKAYAGSRKVLKLRKMQCSTSRKNRQK